MNFLNAAFVALLQSFESTLGVIGDFFMSHLYLAFTSLGSPLPLYLPRSRKNFNNSGYTDDTNLLAESCNDLKELLTEAKEMPKQDCV